MTGLVAALALVVAATLGWPPEARGWWAQEAWSPETAMVLFTASPGGEADLFVQRGRAGTPVNLTDTPGQDHWGRWSPDGRRIVFQTLRDGNREIYAMDADGAHPVNLTQHRDEDILPEWSPDGTRILFFSTRGEQRGPQGEFVGNLWVMNADGTGLQRLTRRPLESSFGGAWAPDGRTVVFTRIAPEGDTDIYLLDMVSGTERRLLRRDGSDGGPRFSPDGTRVAFHAQSGEESRIAVISADGTGLAWLTSGGLHYQPTWSPDGRWLLFTGSPLDGGRRNDLFVVPATGGESRALVATDADERTGSWGPGA